MKKAALLVGINAYPNNPLQGCINDVYDYKSVLEAQGFTCELLLDGQATRAGILAGIDRLISGIVANDGSKIVFMQSSHGSKVKDTNRDEPDGYDEVLCPVDWPKYVCDDDLRAKFSTLPKGTTLDVFLDTCHSGTATRDMDMTTLGARCIPGPLTNGVKAKTITPVPSLNHTLWAACRDIQTSNEVLIDGVPRGIFSYYTCKALRNYPNESRQNLIAAIQKIVATKVKNQTPQLECTTIEAAQKPFT